MGLGEAVPSIGSCVAGLLFGTAWLLWIDGVAFASTEYGEAVNGAYWVPGTLQTIGLIMVNVINWGLLTDDSMMDDGAVAGKAKAWVVVAFVLCFSGVIGSVWILVQEMQHPSWDAGGGAVDTAVRCLLQNLLLECGVRSTVHRSQSSNARSGFALELANVGASVRFTSEQLGAAEGRADCAALHRPVIIHRCSDAAQIALRIGCQHKKQLRRHCTVFGQQFGTARMTSTNGVQGVLQPALVVCDASHEPQRSFRSGAIARVVDAGLARCDGGRGRKRDKKVM